MQTHVSPPIKGILFDKDGTLFDFRATWDVWAGDLIRDLSQGQAAVAEALAREIAFDLGQQAFLPESPVIAGTNREAAEAVARAVPGWEIADLELELSRRAALAPLAPAVPLEPFLRDLRQRGIFLGVMTNDSEAGARAHLQGAGVLDLFHFVAGFDSGFGAKPEPGPLLAFAAHVELAPETVLMVGDSSHDLLAGRRAGMRTLGVLTGVAEAPDLAPLADQVLSDIGQIPAWLDQGVAAL